MSDKTVLVRPAAGQGRVVAGVCAAVADRFGLRRGWVRLFFVIFGLVGAGEIAYLALWIMIPQGQR